MVTSIEDAQYMLNRMDKSYELTVDIEATGLNCKGGVHHPMGIAIGDNHLQSAYFPFNHPLGNNLPWEFFQTIINFLNQKRRTLIWHNLKFDYQAMKLWGVDMRTWICEFIDAMIEMYLLNEEWPNYKLDTLAKHFLNEGKIEKLSNWAKHFGWANVTSSMIDEYARQDVTLPMRLHFIFKAELEQRGIYNLAKFKSRFAMHLGEMERQGVAVNNPFCEEMTEWGEREMASLTQQLGFNPASHDELGDYLLNHLQLPVLARSKKTGKPSFDKKVMERYMAILEGVNDQSARQILDFRGWQKATSSLYRPMLERQDADGRVRTEFRQARTVTGRLASAEPNLQQIPRWTSKPWNGKAKQAFHSGWGDFDLVGYDYSQLELRLGAAYAKEQSLVDEFEKPDADPFRLLAVDLFGEFTDENRFKAKTFTYATNYGAGKGTVARQLGVTESEVDKIYDRYHTSYPGLFTASREVEDRARSRGYIKYWTGRYRHCRYKDQAYKMWNSAMQGGGAELVERSMYRAPNNEECIQLLQVHDEIVFAIRKDRREYYDPIIKDAMTNWNFGVKLVAEGKLWNLAA